MANDIKITLAGKTFTFVDENDDEQFGKEDIVNIDDKNSISHDDFQRTLEAAGLKGVAEQLAKPVSLKNLPGIFKFDPANKLKKVGNWLSVPKNKKEAESRNGVEVQQPEGSPERISIKTYAIEYKTSPFDQFFPQMDIRLDPSYVFPAQDLGMKVWLTKNKYVILKNPSDPETYVAVPKQQYNASIKLIEKRFSDKDTQKHLKDAFVKNIV